MNAVEAILDCLRKLDAKPSDPVNIYAIGPSLIDSGFDTDAIVGALYAPESRKVIELIPGNRIVLLRPLT
jgi:hypothetical protein